LHPDRRIARPRRDPHEVRTGDPPRPDVELQGEDRTSGDGPCLDWIERSRGLRAQRLGIDLLDRGPLAQCRLHRQPPFVVRTVFSATEKRVANDPCSWCIVDKDDLGRRVLAWGTRGEATWTTNRRYGG